MTKMMAKALLGAALVCGAAGAAEATIVTETFTGKIAYGYDGNGLFGAPTADLSGKMLTLRFRLDLGAGGVLSDDGHLTDYYGGSDHGLPTISEVLVAVDGVAVDFGPSVESEFTNAKYLPLSDYDRVSATGFQLNRGVNTYRVATAQVLSNIDDFALSRAFGTQVDYMTSNLSTDAFAYDNLGLRAQAFTDFFHHGNPVHVVITSTSGVPEPASLAALGLGAGLIAVGRRLRKA